MSRIPQIGPLQANSPRRELNLRHPRNLRRLRIGILVLAGLVLTLVYLAATRSPGYSRILDQAGVLDSLDTPYMERYLGQLEQESGVDIRMLIVPTLGGESIEQFAVRSAREIEIGRRTERRSLLFVYAAAEKQLRIEVGPTLQGVFPDAFVGYLMRSHVRHFFGAGNPSLGLRTTLFIVHHRLRRAALGQDYDPSYQQFIEDTRRLAAGGGASAVTPLSVAGSRFINAAADVGELAYFVPQPTPEQSYRRYLEWMALGGVETDISLFTDSSQAFLHDLPLTPGFNDYMLDVEFGQPFASLIRDSLALIYFTDDPLACPHFFRRTPRGWRMDLRAELRNTRNYVGAPWTWGMLDSGDDFSRVFGDRLIAMGPVLRIAGGDARPVPTRDWNFPGGGAPWADADLDRITVTEAAARIDSAGNRPALIVLYQTWNRPTRDAFGQIAALAQRARGRGMLVLAFSTEQNLKAQRELPEFLATHRAPFPPVQVYGWRPGHLDSAMARVGIHIGVTWRHPLIAVRDGDGRIVYQAQHVLDVAASGVDAAIAEVTR